MSKLKDSEIKFGFEEPAMANRFVIELLLGDRMIEPYLISSANIYNDGDKLKMSLAVRHMLDSITNARDFFELTGIKVKYLDPIGDAVKVFEYKISDLLFEQKLDYSSDELLITNFTFTIT